MCSFRSGEKQSSVFQCNFHSEKKQFSNIGLFSPCNFCSEGNYSPSLDISSSAISVQRKSNFPTLDYFPRAISARRETIVCFDVVTRFDRHQKWHQKVIGSFYNCSLLFRENNGQSITSVNRNSGTKKWSAVFITVHFYSKEINGQNITSVNRISGTKKWSAVFITVHFYSKKITGKVLPPLIEIRTPKSDRLFL